MRKFIVTVILFSMTFCSASSQWTEMDRAALAGYLWHPGCKNQFNRTEKKYMQYNCRYHQAYIKKNSNLVKEGVENFFNVFYYYVLQQEKNIFDSIIVTVIEGNNYYKWKGAFDNIKERHNYDTENKLKLITRALAFPCELKYFETEKNSGYEIELDDRNQKFVGTFDRNLYVRILAWLIKDYTNNKTFSYLQIRFGRIVNRINMNDREFFKNMYKQKLIDIFAGNKIH